MSDALVFVLATDNTMDLTTGTLTFQELFLDPDNAPVIVAHADDWDPDEEPTLDEEVRGDVDALVDWLRNPDNNPNPPPGETMDDWETKLRALCAAIAADIVDPSPSGASPYPDLGLGSEPPTVDMSTWKWSNRRSDDWTAPEIATSNPFEGNDMAFRMGMFMLSGILVILAIPCVTAGVTVTPDGEFIPVYRIIRNVLIGLTLAGGSLTAIWLCLTGIQSLNKLTGFFRRNLGPIVFIAILLFAYILWSYVPPGTVNVEVEAHSVLTILAVTGAGAGIIAFVRFGDHIFDFVQRNAGPVVFVAILLGGLALASLI